MGIKPSIPDDGAVDSQIGTAYDVVKSVADNLPVLLGLANDFDNLEQDFVPKTRTVNGKDLSTNIVINYSDLGNIPATLTEYTNSIASATTGIFKKTAVGTWSFTSLVAADIPALDASKITSGTLPVSLGGTGRSDNKSSAWINPRTFTIGSTGKSVDGSAAVTWTLAEIGAQPVDATLTAMAGVTTAADRYIYFTNSDVAAVGTITTFGRSLIDDTDAAAARTTLGLGSAATQASTAFQTVDATLTAIAGLTTASDKGIYATGSDTFATYDLSAFGRNVSATANAAALNTLLGVRTKADEDLITEINSRAVLNLDFVQGIYKEHRGKYLYQVPMSEALDCNRNTAATSDLPSGIVTFDANEPRIVYNPVNGNRLGLLCEEQRTNLLLHSLYTGASGETAPTGWVIGFNTGVTTTAASPRYSGAIRATHTGNVQREFYEQSVLLAAATTYTLSVYFAAGTTANNDVIRIGSADGVWQLGGLAITAAGIYSITFTTTAGGAYSIRVGLGCSSGGTGTVIHETPQLEVGTAPTSYIPTTTAQVTRVADIVSRALTVTNVDAGSIFIEFDLTSFVKGGGLNTTIVKLNNFVNSGNRGFGLTLSQNIYSAYIRNPSSFISISTTVADSLIPTKALISFDNVALKILIAINGVTAELVLSSAIDISAFVSHLFIGGASNMAGTGIEHSKTVKRCTYIPRALTTAEAALITQ